MKVHVSKTESINTLHIVASLYSNLTFQFTLGKFCFFQLSFNYNKAKNLSAKCSHTVLLPKSDNKQRVESINSGPACSGALLSDLSAADVFSISQ